ncbi:MAG: hypothetical protein ABFS43_15205 [Thermodesulfobacteriota bacterium]
MTSIRVIVAVLTVVISVSPLAANSVIPADCPDRSCCCNGAAGAGHAENTVRIQALHSCCCNDVAGSNCSLTTVVPSENIYWALSPNRVDPPSYGFLSFISIDDTPLVPPANFRTDAVGDVIHQGSPPIYLSSMSFLC